MKTTLFWKVFGGYLVAVAVFAATLLAVSFPRVREIYIRDQVRHLENLAGVLEERVLSLLEEEESEEIDRFAKIAGGQSDSRITIIDLEGRVLGDSERDPQTMENHAYRSEVLAAIQGRKDWELRFSSTLNRRMIYMGFPLKRGDGHPAGVIRISVFVRELDAIVSHLQDSILRAVGAAAGIVLLAALLFSRGVTRPVQEFLGASERVAAGDFDVKLSIRRKGEFRAFAESFNAMTSDLKNVFELSESRRRELDTVLASIREGLIVIDTSDRIVLSNPAFRRMLGIGEGDDRFFWEVVRSTSFIELIRRIRENREPAAEEIVIDERHYLCGATWLDDQDKVVVSFHDMTETRNVERIKREFVVNVSHELRTPLTAIKGFIETLEARAGEEDRKYIAIVQRNTDRLIHIVEDLLRLAELEEKGLPKNPGEADVSAVAESVLKVFEPKATEKGLAIALRSQPDLPRVRGDAFQLEQMLVNLVDNAVKYTETGSVTVELNAAGDEIVVEVADTGIGIPSDKLDRVFERFFVVDASRSKKIGGTGLGLSIVKHIVSAHNGRIDIQSEEGKGTTVRVTLHVGASRT